MRLCFNSLLWIITSSINCCFSLEQNTELRNLEEHALTDYSNSVFSVRLETPAVPSVNTRWHQQALQYSASKLKWLTDSTLEVVVNFWFRINIIEWTLSDWREGSCGLCYWNYFTLLADRNLSNMSDIQKRSRTRNHSAVWHLKTWDTFWEINLFIFLRIRRKTINT